MKKIWKVLSLVLVFTLAFAPMLAFATTADTPFDVEISQDAMKGSPLTKIVGSVLGVLQWGGYAVAVIVVLWLGIQWLVAQPAKKAELKGRMWSIAIGLILIVGGVTVINLLWGIISKANVPE